MTKANFSIIIEKLVHENQLTYMEAIVYYCDNNELEVETAAKLINPVIKSKIEVEAQDLNFLPKTSKLPL